MPANPSCVNREGRVLICLMLLLKKVIRLSFPCHSSQDGTCFGQYEKGVRGMHLSHCRMLLEQLPYLFLPWPQGTSPVSHESGSSVYPWPWVTLMVCLVLSNQRETRDARLCQLSAVNVWGWLFLCRSGIISCQVFSNIPSLSYSRQLPSTRDSQSVSRERGVKDEAKLAVVEKPLKWSNKK